MIHSSDYDPRVYPYKGAGSSGQIDRVQDMSASVTLNRTKIEEIGRDGLIDWRKAIPEISVTLRQLEYGNIDFWRKLANTTDVDTQIFWSDYDTPQVDIAAYETDDDGTFLSTVWYPNLRLSGFTLNIGSPEDMMERNFTLVGEDEITLQGTNKYLIVLQDETCIGATHTIDIGDGIWANYPTPIVDPDESGTDTYILKIVRVTAAGVTSELVETTNYTYSSVLSKVTIPASVSGDTYKVYYSAGSYITAQTPWTNNDADAGSLLAEHTSIYLETSNYVYRLQDVSIDVAFDRNDVREIGNDEVVLRGVRDVSTTVTLGRILDQWTVEEILRGVATNYPKINVRKFADNMNLIIKLYSDETKTTFLMGYAFTDLAPTSIDNGTTLNEYVTRGVTLEGEVGFVTTDESLLNALT